MSQIFCVNVLGSNVPPEISDFLLQAASELYRSKKAVVNIQSEFCDGYISTKYAYGGLGNVYGVIFKGEESWDGHTSKVEFICKTNELEDLPVDRVWVRQAFSFADDFPQPTLN